MANMNKNIRLRIKNLITSALPILCEKLGIIVLYDNLGDLKKPQGRKVTVVSSLLSKFAQISVLAHKLVHAILHSGSTVL